MNQGCLVRPGSVFLALLSSGAILACGGGEASPGGESGGTSSTTSTGGSSGGGGSNGGVSGSTGGDTGTDTAELPFPEAQRIATTGTTYCAVTDGPLLCWGSLVEGAMDWPDTPPAVSIHGESSFHAITADGLVFGFAQVEPFAWQAIVAEGPFRAAADDKVIHADGSLLHPVDGVWTDSGFTWVGVATMADFLCGISAVGGAAVCPENPSDSGRKLCGLSGGLFVPPTGSFSQLDAGGSHFCALGTSGEVECWGGGSVAAEPDPDLRPDCTVAPEDSNEGQDVPLPGTYRHVSAGMLHTCAVRTDGTVACWGAGTTADDCVVGWECGQSMPPPDADFVQVAAGQSNTCALKESGKVVCWGSNTGGRSTPPPELQP